MNTKITALGTASELTKGGHQAPLADSPPIPLTFQRPWFGALQSLSDLAAGNVKAAMSKE